MSFVLILVIFFRFFGNLVDSSNKSIGKKTGFHKKYLLQ